MYKRLVEQTRHEILVGLCIVLLSILAALVIFGYQRQIQLISFVEVTSSKEAINRLIESSFSYYSVWFLVTTLVIGILALCLVFLIHVSAMHGFKQGYIKGIQDSSSKDS